MNTVTATGRVRYATGTFTRPADTTAYTAGDVMNNSASAGVVTEIPNVGLSAHASTIIQQAICVDSANQATKPDLELWLFDTAVTADNDNAVFTPTDAELRTLVAVIAFPSTSFKAGDATSGAGGNCVCDIQNLGIPVRVTGTQVDSLYGVVVVRNAYTPVSAERFDFFLKLID